MLDLIFWPFRMVWRVLGWAIGLIGDLIGLVFGLAGGVLSVLFGTVAFFIGLAIFVWFIRWIVRLARG